MAEWLENHHEWLFILALIWIVYTFFQVIKDKYNRSKKRRKQVDKDTSSIVDFIGTGTGTEQVKPAGYGGGSSGGAGSSRGFTSPSHVNSAMSNDLNNIAGITMADSAATNIAQEVGLSDITPDTSSQAMIESIASVTPDTDTIIEVAEIAIETTAEAVSETIVEVAGAIVEGVLKD